MLCVFYHHVEESYVTEIEYGFQSHDVEVIDTAGQEEFLLFRDSSMAQGDAFLVVFAIDSVSSWQHLKELRSKIVQEKDDQQNIPMVVVANKRVSMTVRKNLISTDMSGVPKEVNANEK